MERIKKKKEQPGKLRRCPNCGIQVVEAKSVTGTKVFLDPTLNAYLVLEEGCTPLVKKLKNIFPQHDHFNCTIKTKEKI